jgi:hypothetical protein
MCAGPLFAQTRRSGRLTKVRFRKAITFGETAGLGAKRKQRAERGTAGSGRSGAEADLRRFQVECRGSTDSVLMADIQTDPRPEAAAVAGRGRIVCGVGARISGADLDPDRPVKSCASAAGRGMGRQGAAAMTLLLALVPIGCQPWATPPAAKVKSPLVATGKARLITWPFLRQRRLNADAVAAEAQRRDSC